MKFKLLAMALVCLGASAQSVFPPAAGTGSGGLTTVTGALAVGFAGSALVAGAAQCFSVSYTGTTTITSWDITTLGTGNRSAVFGVWKAAKSTSSNPTVANSIVASAPPTLTSDANATGSVGTWTATTLASTDRVCISLTSFSGTITSATLVLNITHQ